MRTKYIGFVKTSFSSPSLPFRIGGYAPGGNSQFPSFTHPPRTSTLRSRRIPKRSKVAFRKSQHAHKAKRFFPSLPGLVRCPFPTIESVKGRCTRLCEKSDKKLGRNAQLPPSFLFFSPLFSENNATHRSVSRGGAPNTYGNSANTLTRETAPVRHSYAKQMTAQPADAGFAHSRLPNLRASPQPPPFRSRTKKQLPIFRWIAVRKDVGAEGFEPPTLCL